MMSPYNAPNELRIFGISTMPEIKKGDNISDMILEHLAAAREELVDGDVVVVAQKIISKAEGRYIDLNAIKPKEKTIRLAKEVNKDPRLVEIILGESKSVIAKSSGILIVEHKSGVILANAGVDRSNVQSLNDSTVTLLPKNADQSASTLLKNLGKDIAVIINDSIGRAWRVGTTGTAIGVAGLSAIIDMNGRPDMQGRTLKGTTIALADELASAASIVMGQASEARPVVIIRGLSQHLSSDDSKSLLRPPEKDLFR